MEQNAFPHVRYCYAGHDHERADHEAFAPRLHNESFRRCAIAPMSVEGYLATEEGAVVVHCRCLRWCWGHVDVVDHDEDVCSASERR